MQLEYSFEYDAQFDEGTEKEFILNLKAKNKSVAYDKLKMWITKTDKILRKVKTGKGGYGPGDGTGPKGKTRSR